MVERSSEINSSVEHFPHHDGGLTRQDPEQVTDEQKMARDGHLDIVSPDGFDDRLGCSTCFYGAEIAWDSGNEKQNL